MVVFRAERDGRPIRRQLAESVDAGMMGLGSSRAGLDRAGLSANPGEISRIFIRPGLGSPLDQQGSPHRPFLPAPALHASRQPVLA